MYMREGQETVGMLVNMCNCSPVVSLIDLFSSDGVIALDLVNNCHFQLL